MKASRFHNWKSCLRTRQSSQKFTVLTRVRNAIWMMELLFRCFTRVSARHAMAKILGLRKKEMIQVRQDLWSTYMEIVLKMDTELSLNGVHQRTELINAKLRKMRENSRKFQVVHLFRWKYLITKSSVARIFWQILPSQTWKLLKLMKIARSSILIKLLGKNARPDKTHGFVFRVTSVRSMGSSSMQEIQKIRIKKL